MDAVKRDGRWTRISNWQPTGTCARPSHGPLGSTGCFFQLTLAFTQKRKANVAMRCPGGGASLGRHAVQRVEAVQSLAFLLLLLIIIIPLWVSLSHWPWTALAREMYAGGGAAAVDTVSYSDGLAVAQGEYRGGGQALHLTGAAFQQLPRCTLQQPAHPPCLLLIHREPLLDELPSYLLPSRPLLLLLLLPPSRPPRLLPRRWYARPQRCHLDPPAAPQREVEEQVQQVDPQVGQGGVGFADVEEWVDPPASQEGR
jgi:hypothetical protein